MDTIYKIAIGAIIAVILTTTIKANNKELALLLSLGACVVLLLPGLRMFDSIKDFYSSLQSKTGLEPTVLRPLTKICAIGLVTQLSAYFCQDAGENTIAKVIELCGGIASFCVAIPLLSLVLDTLEGLLSK